MAFREVSVVQVREALRRWLHGDGERPIARQAGIDRKTARRYIAAAIELGVNRNGDESQLTDELVGQVCERVRPRRPDGHGDSWRVLLECLVVGFTMARSTAEARATPPQGWPDQAIRWRSRKWPARAKSAGAPEAHPLPGMNPR